MLKKIGEWLKDAAQHSRFRIFAKNEWLLLNFNEGGTKFTFYFAIFRGKSWKRTLVLLRVYLMARVFCIDLCRVPIVGKPL